MAVLALPILLCHQTEEWVRPGGFLPFCNQRLLGSGRPTWPLTERDAFHINVTVGWSSAVAAAALWRRTPVVAAGVLCLEGANALMHTSTAIRERRYNPGLLTAIVMAAHAGAASFWLVRSRRLSPRAGLLAAGASVAAPAALVVGLRRRLRIGGRI